LASEHFVLCVVPNFHFAVTELCEKVMQKKEKEIT